MKKFLLRIFLIGAVISISLQPSAPLFASIVSPNIGGNDIYSAGRNLWGTVGDGNGQFQTSLAEFQLPAGLTVKKVLQTLPDILVIASDDQLYGAGRNVVGELGAGDRNMHTTPVKFQLPVGVTAVSVHTYHRDAFDFDEAIHVLASDGNVYSAGSNFWGILGDAGPTNVNVSTPVKFQLPAGVTALEVDAQQDNTFVRASDGKVYGAGRNSAGELGNGTTTLTSTPVVFQLPGGVTATKLASTPMGAYINTFAVIGSDGNVYGTGYNGYGNLGNGATSSTQTTPVVFQLPGGLTAQSVIVNDTFTSVLASDNQVYTAGSNYSGVLGNGTFTDSSTPVKFQLPGGITVAKQFTDLWGSIHSVIGSDGNFYTTGGNSYGVQGNGTTSSVSTPFLYPLPGGATATDALLLPDLMMVVASDGNVYVSGQNASGQTGNGNTSNQTTPIRYNIPAGLTVTSFAAPVRDFAYSTHVVASGRVFGAGMNDNADLGDGTLINRSTPVEMALPVGVTAKDVYSYRDRDSTSTCVVSTVDKLYCAGRNVFGQLGSGSETTYTPDPKRFVLPAGVYPTTLHMLNNAIYTIGTDGQVYGAGVNTTGQLGNGTTTNQFTPVRFQLPAGLTAVDVLFPSNQAVYVLASDGQVYGAGTNSGVFAAGTLGNGTSVDQSTPVKFQLPAGVTATGFFKEGGIDLGGPMVKGSDGNVYTTGFNAQGQRGVGNTTSPLLTPQKYILPAGVTAVKALSSQDTSYVLGSDGQVYGAGINTYGQLGLGFTSASVSTPAKFILPAGLTAVSMVGDRQHVFVLASDGNIYGAGRNNLGQLGDGTNTTRSTPVKYQLPAGVTVPTMENVFDHFGDWMMVTGSDGQLYSTGSNTITDYGGNTYARLGNGTASAYEATPVKFQLPAGLTVTQLVTGFNPWNVSVIASDGQLYLTGANIGGQMGNGTPLGSSTPVKFALPAGKTVKKAMNESYATFALTPEGELYVAGCNTFENTNDVVASGCNGWLGTGSTETQLVATKFVLPAGLKVMSFTGMLGYNLTVFTEPLQAVGGQTYCDANTNGVQDPGESLVNGQTVLLFNSVNGTATGSPIDSYTSDTYDIDNGVFFFDGLPSGEYILGMSTDSGMIYSQPVTLAANGDGWILGSSQLITSASAIGQTGFVCGTSTTVTPNTPGKTLAPTGMSVTTLLSSIGGAMIIAAAVLVIRTKAAPERIRF